jgi:hypothetical protein
MKAISHINSADLLTIDIEVVRLSKDFSKLPENFRSAWSYKLKHEGEMPSEEELADKWEKMASLYAEFAKICAISITYLKDGVLKCKSYYGTDEKEIILNLAKYLHEIKKTVDLLQKNSIPVSLYSIDNTSSEIIYINPSYINYQILKLHFPI